MNNNRLIQLNVSVQCILYRIKWRVGGETICKIFFNMADSDAAGCALLRLMLQAHQKQKPKTNAPEGDKLIAYWWIIIT